MGRLVPAGTGLSAYKRWRVVVEDEIDTAPSFLPGPTASSYQM